MNTSAWLAKLIGPYIILIGAALALNIRAFLRIEEDFFKNAALLFLTGLITFVSGLAIVLIHNLWAADWRVLITVFGWIALIKGAWLVIMPDTAMKLGKVFVKDIKLAVIPWSLMIIIGIFLCVKGFMG